MSGAQFIDNSAEYQARLNRAIEAALEDCGARATTHVVQNLTKDAYKHPVDWYQRTDNLKKFSHHVEMDEKAVYVGTNTKYAVYWEYGTGVYAEKGGRPGWWVFVPDDSGHQVGGGKVYTEEKARQIMAILQSKGVDAHMTQGIKPVHMLKRAIEDHKAEYRQTISQHLAAVGGKAE